MTNSTAELCEPDNPAAWALAQHIADHPVSTIQAAFRYLNTPLTLELREAPAVVEPPADQTGEVRDQLLHAIDFNYVASLGYTSPEELLAAYDTSRTPAADRTALRKAIAHAIHRYDNHHALSGNDIPSKHHYGEADAVLAVLPEPTDRAADAPAAECSAQHRRFDDGRLCIRAAQHHGDHIDERGYHWSDTVAVYPVADGTFRPGTDVRAALRRMADETATDQADTLPAWLYQRFMPDGIGWDQLDEDDRSYWEHQARAVRRAVARGGFKQPAAGARQDETPDAQTQPATPMTAHLATLCDVCDHTLKRHRNDVGCTVTGCVCGPYRQPAAAARQDGATS